MNLSTFQSNGKYGYKDGFSIVIPAQYEAVSLFHEGFAVAVLNNRFGIIDVKGNFVVENKYDDLCHLFDNYLSPASMTVATGFVELLTPKAKL